MASRASRIETTKVGLTAWFTAIAVPRFWQVALLLGAGIGLSYGLSVGLSAGLSAEVNIGLRYGLSAGRSAGLSTGLSNGFSTGLIVSVTIVLIDAILDGMMGSLRFAERIHWTWRDLFRLKHLRASLIVAATLFLFFGLSDGLIVGLSVGLIVGLGAGALQPHFFSARGE